MDRIPKDFSRVLDSIVGKNVRGVFTIEVANNAHSCGRHIANFPQKRNVSDRVVSSVVLTTYSGEKRGRAPGPE
jgi:hypothetical protein